MLQFTEHHRLHATSIASGGPMPEPHSTEPGSEPVRLTPRLDTRLLLHTFSALPSVSSSLGLTCFPSWVRGSMAGEARHLGDGDAALPGQLSLSFLAGVRVAQMGVEVLVQHFCGVLAEVPPLTPAKTTAARFICSDSINVPSSPPMITEVMKTAANTSNCLPRGCVGATPAAVVRTPGGHQGSLSPSQHPLCSSS